MTDKKKPKASHPDHADVEIAKLKEDNAMLQRGLDEANAALAKLQEQAKLDAATIEDLWARERAKDDEIAGLHGSLQAAARANEAWEEKVKDLQAQLDAKDDALVNLRSLLEKTDDIVEHQAKLLADAGHPTHGIAPPPTLDNLPTLDQIPVHKPLANDVDPAFDFTGKKLTS